MYLHLIVLLFNVTLACSTNHPLCFQFFRSTWLRFFYTPLRYISGEVRYGRVHQSSASLCPLSVGTPGACIWPSPKEDAWHIPISLRCPSTSCNHKARGHPVGHLSRGSLTEIIVWAEWASGNWATYLYSRSWHWRAVQVTNLIWVSATTRWTQSDQR